MKCSLRAIRSAGLSIALLGLASGQAQTGEPGLSPAAIKAHVAFLADDLLEGRETGTRGHEIAARYVAAKFAELGLTPAGDAGDWFQTVRLDEHVLNPTRSALTISGRQASRRWTHATDVIITASPVAQAQSIEAPVVFAGFGIDAPQRGFNDYDGLDVRGKIVAVLIGTPQGTPSEMGAHLAATKERMAQQRGALGMIMFDTRIVRSLFPWQRRLQNDASPRMTWTDSQGRPFVSAPGILASVAINKTAAAVLFAGAKRSLDAVLDEADKHDGRPKGFALPASARIEWQSTHRARTSPNVLGLIPGQDPALKDEVVLMMAHLDHVGMRPAKNGNTIVNGAIDNAMGVAIMLDVARAFASTAQRPRRSILFLANTAEEKGLLGTEYFANRPTVPLERIVGVLNLDVPILTYDFIDVIAFGAEHSTLHDDVAKAAAAAGVALSPDPLPDEGLFTRSDHYALVKKGVPALFLATGHGAAGKQAWQTYLQHHYHQPSDDLSQPLDWNAAARFARINSLLLREICNADTRPRWYEGSFFGDTFAPSAPKAEHK